jgi:serine/threonine protein kinase
MELLEGGSLRERIADKPLLDENTVRLVMFQILTGNFYYI